MALPPNTELVAVAWLKTVAGLNPNLIATTVPKPNPEFAQHGFVQVTAGLGGEANSYTGMQGPIVQIDLWAYQEGSKKVPWGKAATLGAHIKAAVEGVVTHNQLVETPEAFDDARVHSVITHMDLRRIPGDEAMARYMLELRLFWTRQPEEVAV